MNDRPPEDDGADISGPVKAHNGYWDAYAKAFAQPLQANGLLSAFVTNANVTGAYAEAWVRSMTRNMLSHRFRVSTGAVIRSGDRIQGLRKVPQCDLIVWDPSDLPAVFESGEFALVPSFAARAIIEVKRTPPKKADLASQLKKHQKLLLDYGPVLGVVIRHPKALFDPLRCNPGWLGDYRFPPPSKRYKTGNEPPMTRLLGKDSEPDTSGIMAFIYFLAQVAGHTR